jgi:hypothetical protein
MYVNWAEKRKQRRRDTAVPALAVGQDGKPIAPCVMKDISNGGARLAFADHAEIPDWFVLWLSKGGKPRRNCRVQWRRGVEIGVAFVGPLLTS